jgi:hypothetical protein
MKENMSSNDKLSEVFDVEPIEYTQATQVLPAQSITQGVNINYDYETTRSNLHAILAQGQDALTHALNVAKNSEHPRAFEVVGGLMKHLSDINAQLLDLNKKKQQLDNPKSANKEGPVTNNSIFVGSTAELSKMINDLKKGK